MKWVLSHATDELHHWLLQQEEDSRSLIFNRQRLSLRLNGFSKRLFFLETEGFLQKKILLRSEYGVTLGEATFADKSSPGQLSCNGQKFFFQMEGEKLALFDSDKNPVGACVVPQGEDLERYEFYGLLFGFTWLVTADAMAEQQRRLLVTA